MENKDVKSSKDKRNNVIVIILSVLLITLTIMYFRQRSEDQAYASQLTAEKDSITVELSKMVTNYNSIKTENDTLNKTITVTKNKVADLLKEVEHVKHVSFEQISKYRDEVTTLRTIMRSYIVQIDSLNQRNQQLMTENVDVKKQVTEAKTINQQLSQEKQKLEQTVSLAAQLTADNLKAIGINSKGKEQNKASKIDKIKIDFSLSKNLTAKRGSKNIYIRIQRPDQVLLMKSDKDLFKFENLKIPYSATREIEYEGSDLPVSIYWDNQKEAALVPGKYTIDVFTDGLNIGTTTLDIK
jgi:FtsZ-binding cell division protein ZapB